MAEGVRGGDVMGREESHASVRERVIGGGRRVAEERAPLPS